VLGGFVGQEFEREEEASGRQAGGAVAEIGFIEGKRGLAVERVENISDRARDETAWAEGFPAAGRAVGEGEMFAVETDGDHAAGTDVATETGHGAFEIGPVAREAAGNLYGGRKAGAKTGRQGSSVDEQAVAEHEHVAEIRRGETRAKR